MRQKLLALWMILIPAICPVRANAQGNDLLARFRQEAPVKWADYAAYIGDIQSSATKTTIGRVAGKTGESQTRYELKRRPHHLLWSWEHTKGQVGGQCWAMNDRYAFHLTKGNGGWALADLDSDVADGLGIPYLAQEAKAEPDWSKCPFTIYTEVLPELVDKKGFHAEKAQRVTEEGSDLIRIDFRYDRDKQERGNYYPKSGWFVLDPQQYWRLHEYELHMVYGSGQRSLFRGTVQCRTGSGNYPLLTRIVARESITTPGEAPIEQEITTEFSLAEGAPPPEAFTLSAFGLPEPREFTPPPTTRYYLWFAVAGLALVVAAVVFRRLARPAATAET